MGQKQIKTLTSPPIIIQPARCSGCGRCIAACPEKLYSLETHSHRKTSRNKNPAKCSLCGKCIAACPLGIIMQPVG